MDEHCKGVSAAAIQSHYDTGNAFYRLWLDAGLNYSAALWETGDNLESAQLRKLDFHIQQAGASGAEQVLDIGCGWGSLLTRLVQRYGVKSAVGLTLSGAQEARIKALDQPRIEVRRENWLDHRPARPYDAIISIGAFEHFAAPGLTEVDKIDAYRAFFQACHDWLKPGGRLSLQTIIYENADTRDVNEFLSQDIFPESELPHLAELVKARERLFEIVTLRNDGKHYERTLRHWLKNLRAKRKEAVALVGERETSKYEKYLSLCMIGFHSTAFNLSRIMLRRIDGFRTSLKPID